MKSVKTLMGGLGLAASDHDAILGKIEEKKGTPPETTNSLPRSLGP